MKVLFVLQPRAKVSDWHRLGDTSMATRLIRHLPSDITVDVVSDFSEYESNSHVLRKLLDDYKINQAIDISPYTKRRTYLKDSMTWLSESGILEGYDIIHLHNANLSTISYVDKFMKGKKVIYSMHTPPEVRSFEHYYREKYEEMCRNPDQRLVAVSRNHMERITHILKGELPSLTYVSNGVEVEKVDNPPTMYDLTVIGRVDNSKKIVETLRAIKLITDKTGGNALYVGDLTTTNETHPSYEKHKAYEAEVQLIVDDSHIHWERKATPYQIRHILSRTKVYISLCDFETYGLTVAEAMMQGTPCLGVDSGGIGELISEGVSGYKLSKQRSTWSQKYKELESLYHKALKLDREVIRTYAVCNLSIKYTAIGYDKIYHSLMKGTVQ